MDQNENTPSVGGFALLLRLVAALENLAAAVLDVRDCLRSGKMERSEDPYWLTVKEAADRSRFSVDFLYEKNRQGRLWFSTGEDRKLARVPRFHLDEQVARRFPLLDMESIDELIERCREKTTNDLRLLIPGRRVDGRKKIPDRLELPKRRHL